VALGVNLNVERLHHLDYRVELLIAGFLELNEQDELVCAHVLMICRRDCKLAQSAIKSPVVYFF